MNKISDLLGALFSGTPIHFKFENNRQVGRDSEVNKPKTKTKVSRSNNGKTKYVNKGTAVDTGGGGITYVGGNVNYITVQLGPDGKVADQDIAQLAPIVNAFENKDVAFLAAKSSNTINDIHSFEDSDEVRGLLKFFRPRLNPNDLIRLRIGLYIKHLNETDYEQAAQYWRQVTSNQRQRDRRLIELASAGYFSTFFRPLYKQYMKSNPETAQKRFSKEFESILEDLRFVFFVSNGMEVEAIVEKALGLAIKNIKYGLKTEVLSLHAAGSKPVSRLRDATIILRSTFPVMRMITTPKGAHILRVDIEYKKNNIDESLLHDDPLILE